MPIVAMEVSGAEKDVRGEILQDDLANDPQKAIVDFPFTSTNIMLLREFPLFDYSFEISYVLPRSQTRTALHNVGSPHENSPSEEYFG